MISKNLGVLVIGTLTFSNFLLPATTIAQQAGQSRGAQFCARLEGFTSQMNQRVDERRANIVARRDARKDDLVERRGERRERREEHRERWQENRDAHYAKLTAMATTDTEKQAVLAFQAAVEAAVGARKVAVDAANDAFRQGLDQLIADRKAKGEAVVNAFTSSVRAGLDKAKTDCAGGSDPAAIRETFRTSMKSAQDAFAVSRQAIEKLRDTVPSLQATRRAALEDAKADFEAAIEKARVDLKAGLGTG